MVLNVLFIRMKFEFRVLRKPSKYVKQLQCMFKVMAESHAECWIILKLVSFAFLLRHTFFPKSPSPAPQLCLPFLSV